MKYETFTNNVKLVSATFTYKATVMTSGEDCKLTVEICKKAGPFLTLLSKGIVYYNAVGTWDETLILLVS
jgi:hypothetical protein